MMCPQKKASSFVPAALLLLLTVPTKTSDAYLPRSAPSTRAFYGAAVRVRAAVGARPTALRYANYTDVVSATESAPTVFVNDDPASAERRADLKKELARCSIENYDMEAYSRGQTTVAEDIMKGLEPIRPWARPANHPGLNARFSFVFTGVPTIGMRLITLLSRISVGFPVVEFNDVFLEVYNRNTKAKAIVTFKLFGIPFELNVNTDLCPPDKSCPEGTMMIEQFQSLTLQGATIPTPESWHNSRTLEITYLDEDMMIARTAGGEPHFLLRHSSCSTDDATCDVANELTDYFEEATEKYGEMIARCLVDRRYAEQNDCGDRSTNPLTTVLSLEPGSLFGNGEEGRNAP